MGCAWVVSASILIFDSPELHPRISPEELAYLEPYCLKKQNGKKVTTADLIYILTNSTVFKLIRISSAVVDETNSIFFLPNRMELHLREFQSCYGKM